VSSWAQEFATGGKMLLSTKFAGWLICHYQYRVSQRISQG
jgi:hypothetical protein